MSTSRSFLLCGTAFHLQRFISTLYLLRFITLHPLRSILYASSSTIEFLDETLDSRERILRRAYSANVEARKAQSLSSLVRREMSPEERQLTLEALLDDPENSQYSVIYEPDNTSARDGAEESQIDVGDIAAVDVESASGIDLDEGITGEIPDNNTGEPAEKDKVEEQKSLEIGKYRALVKRSSATAPSLERAGTDCGLNSPIKLQERNEKETVLKGWQVRAIAWMLAQEEGELKSGILADGCGLGKTLTVLYFLYFSSTRNTTPPYNPTLVVAPPRAIDTWFLEIRDRFKNEPEDPETGRTIVLTSYQTFVQRNRAEDANGKGGKSDEPTDNDVIPKEVQADDQSTKSETTDIKPTCKRAEFDLTGRFARVICDEGDALRKIHTKAYKEITNLQCPSTWILTATPMVESPENFVLSPGGDSEYEKTDTDKPKSLDLLSPAKLARLTRDSDINTTDRGLRVVLSSVCLARAAGDPVDPSSTAMIGDDIPDISIWTPELKYNQALQLQHDGHYFTRFSREEQSFLAVSSRLYEFVKRFKEDSDKSLEGEINKRRDQGFHLFFSKTCRDPACLIPALRRSMAYYLGLESPKLHYMLKIFRQEGMFGANGSVSETSPRFIVFCRWPVVIWFVELFLESLSIPCGVLRPQTRDSDLVEMMERFNNDRKEPFDDEKEERFDYDKQKDKRCTVILTTFACGMNLKLHLDCSRAIIFEPAPNYNPFIHAIGRLHRLTPSAWPGRKAESVDSFHGA
ncbi:P-loop containing nucleoside triphosphate hydrolase protein [Aspergillus multicolor]|uniref:P-loop containing nucleoside triphosphate hydrolase protein n=1 Tax=Aspergillus multicolor TaxID=41759 RepID=UPI003CCDDD3E